MKFDPKDFLEHYKHSISGKLYKQLKKNNNLIIEQILHLNPNEFILFKGVGLKTVRELINFQKSIMLSMKNHPNDHMLSSSTSRTIESKALNRSIDDYSQNILPKNIEIIIMNSKMLSLDIIEAIIKDYFALKPDFIRDRNIVFKRFGIDLKRMYTLEELAIYYNVTRERIRQIQQKHLDTLKTLFSSNYLFKLRCEISKDALDYISSFIDMFINNNIINLSKIKHMLCNKYNLELIPSKIPLWPDPLKLD